MLLALFKTATCEGMVRIDAQHSTPSCSGLLVMPEGVMDGRQMKASIEVITAATDRSFEVRSRFLEPFPAQVQQTSLVPRMSMVWSGAKGFVEGGFCSFWAVQGNVAGSQLRQGVVMVRHSLNDDFQVAHCIVPLRETHLGFGPS